MQQLHLTGCSCCCFLPFYLFTLLPFYLTLPVLMLDEPLVDEVVVKEEGSDSENKGGDEEGVVVGGEKSVAETKAEGETTLPP